MNAEPPLHGSVHNAPFCLLRVGSRWNAQLWQDHVRTTSKCWCPWQATCEQGRPAQLCYVWVISALDHSSPSTILLLLETRDGILRTDARTSMVAVRMSPMVHTLEDKVVEKIQDVQISQASATHLKG